MSDKSKFDTLVEMVPFYINGTLSAKDRSDFEAALETHPELAAELERETALQKQFVGAMDETLDQSEDPSDAKVQSLFGAPQRSSGSKSGLSKALSFLNPANWNPAVTFALAAAAVGQTAIIGDQSSTISDLEAENFQLASGNKDCESDPAILIELAETAAWSDVTALLDSQQVSIVGTGSFGVLQLAHDNEDADTAATVAALAASDLVVSAEAAN